MRKSVPLLTRYTNRSVSLCMLMTSKYPTSTAILGSKKQNEISCHPNKYQMQSALYFKQNDGFALVQSKEDLGVFLTTDLKLERMLTGLTLICIKVGFARLGSIK